MASPSGRAGHSIAAVSKLTGVSCHALRVWERRYGFPVPERSASGHRRYTQDQIRVLRRLSTEAQTGQLIGDLIEQYLAGRLSVGDQALGAPPEEKPPFLPVIDHLFRGEMDLADLMLDRLTEGFPPLEYFERVIAPALVEVGERWFRGDCGVYQERLASICLLGRAERMLEQVRRNNRHPARTVLVGSVRGDFHGGGVLMISLAIELAGWRAVSLGSNLPSEEYRKACEAWRPDALALSFVLSRNINKRFEELSKIKSVPVLVGGRSILNHQGLARRHGLIPLTGPLSTSASRLIHEVNRWNRRPGRPIEQDP